MFNNLSIRKKLLVLTGTILTLLLVVIILSYDGISSTIRSNQKTTQLNEVNNKLAQLEIAHLNWARNVSNFLSDDKINQLEVQTDPTRCGFGQWYYGDGRKKLEEQVPETHSDLIALEATHNRLHASAIKIKEAYREADPTLPNMLIAKEVDHMNWAYKIQKAIIAQEDHVKVKFDHNQCELGKFINNYSDNHAISSNPELTKTIEDLNSPHKRLHEQGRKIDELLQKQQHQAAALFFAEEASKTLAQGREHLSKAVKLTKEALDAKNKAQLIFYTETQPLLEKVGEYINSIQETTYNKALTNRESNVKAAHTKQKTAMIFGVLALFIGLLLSATIGHSLTGPMQQTVTMLEELERGHLDSRLNLKRRDEIGIMSQTMDRFADSLQSDIVAPLARLAEGDLTFNIIPYDEKDTLRGKLKQLGHDLNQMMEQILTTGNAIASASNQIASSSLSLSQGATESAASLEQISASLNQTSSQTTQNSDSANQANTLTAETKKSAEEGRQRMQSMVSAMKEISDSGQDISKIIATIDEIAFQTNLLALNAAVEAARAGQHGKGFAVVAEEVRNLAARSAKAAAETEILIESSVEKTNNGSNIAEKTAEALEEIVGRIGQVTNIVAEINNSSNEQAQGISEINTGISQIDIVTQQNTASAEESASAAEEMASQAEMLKEMLQRFKLRHHHSDLPALSEAREKIVG